MPPLLLSQDLNEAGTSSILCRAKRGSTKEGSMSGLFTWSGQYVGFIRNGKMFNRSGGYLGWIDDDGRAWNSEGHYIGDFVDGGYVLRNRLRMTPMNRIPRVRPISPVPPISRMNRIGRVRRAGYDDALERFL